MRVTVAHQSTFALTQFCLHLGIVDDWSEADFQWDQHNIDHAERHGITPRLLSRVASGEPLLFAEKRTGRSGSHLLIGPDEAGRFWTVVLARLGANRWRPITGWPSTNSEIRLYEEAREP